MKNKVNLSELADAFNVAKSTVTRWRKTGKLKGLIDKNGMVDLDKAMKILPGRIAPRQQAAAAARWKAKAQKPEATDADISAEVKSYLDESMEDLSRLDIYELQRRNELEKLLVARFKRLQMEGTLIPLDQACREAAECARAVRDAILGIPDRVSALLAAESDPWKVKQMLRDELRQALFGLQDQKRKLTDISEAQKTMKY